MCRINKIHNLGNSPRLLTQFYQQGNCKRREGGGREGRMLRGAAWERFFHMICVPGSWQPIGTAEGRAWEAHSPGQPRVLGGRW